MGNAKSELEILLNISKYTEKKYCKQIIHVFSNYTRIGMLQKVNRSFPANWQYLPTKCGSVSESPINT